MGSRAFACNEESLPPVIEHPGGTWLKHLTQEYYKNVFNTAALPVKQYSVGTQSPVEFLSFTPGMMWLSGSGGPLPPPQ